MLKPSAAWIAALGIACGGGTPAPTTPSPPPPSDASSTSTTPAAVGSSAPEGSVREKVRLLTPDQLAWKPLVPELGDKGPQLASLWGDMTTGPSGFFIKLPPGDKGTLHTHSHDYHGIAIAGGNASSQQGNPVKPVAPGTYWLQPAGAAHTNACTGSEPCIGFAQFTDGKFDSARSGVPHSVRPDPRYVEKRLSDITWTPFDAANPKAGAWAQLWGDNKSGPSGMLFKLPPNNTPSWHFHKSNYHAVVLQGTPQHYQSGTDGKDLPVGTYWWQPGGYKHVDLCKGTVDCIVYAYYEGPFDFVAQ